MSFTWQNGRQLASLTKNGSTYNYTYNPDGVRIGKSGAKNVTYEVAGTQILKETIGSTVIAIRILQSKTNKPVRSFKVLTGLICYG